MRARQRSCLCPKLRLLPPTATGCASPAGSASTNLAIEPRSRALQSCSSLWPPKGSRLSRTLPEKSTGSCGTRPTDRRSSRTPTEAASTSLIATVPHLGGTRRRMASSRVDFPEPVAPTTPTLRPAATWRQTPRSTSSELEYLTARSRISTEAPPASQSCSVPGPGGEPSCPASGGRSTYSWRRLTLMRSTCSALTSSNQPWSISIARFMLMMQRAKPPGCRCLGASTPESATSVSMKVRSIVVRTLHHCIRTGDARNSAFRWSSTARAKCARNRDCRP
mmetsp:Transcript_22367/g.66631  ORF Transcript_22367/g.66631 Transcript_22367/m.66631 type:complete len:279 (+) Transcript_22367:423-1259(+)